MNEQKAWHKSGTQWYLLKADILKYWFVVVSVLALECCEGAKELAKCVAASWGKYR